MSITITNKPRKIDFAKNQLFLRVITSQESSGYEDYHVRAKISVENLSTPGTYFELPEFRLEVDSGGLTSLYDIGRVISQRVSKYFDLPDWSMSGMAKTLATIARYKVTFKEMDGPDELNSTGTGELKAIDGRVNQASHKNFSIKSWITENTKFLTNSPEQIYIYAGAKFYLYYLNPFSNSLDIKLRIEADTPAGQESFTSSKLNLQSEESAIIPVSEIIEREFGGDLYKAKVWLYNASDNTVAGPKTYHFMNKRLFAKSFVFQNRFGVFDTLTTVEEKNSLETERYGRMRNISPSYKSLDGNLSSELESVDDIFEAETGPIPIPNAQHYKEMLESNNVFLQGKDRWIKIWVDKGRFNISDESEDLQNVSFQYKAAFTGDLLSSELSMPEQEQEDYSNEYLKTDYK